MDTTKLVELVDRLTAKTEAGQLTWREGLRADTYETHFPRQSITVEGPVSDLVNLAQPDQYAIRIYDGEGEMALSASGSLVPVQPNQVDVTRLSRLTRAAHRSIRAKREKVVDELLAELG